MSTLKDSNTYTRMLFIGMWMSFTKYPMKPMTAKPTSFKPTSKCTSPTAGLRS
ncbi:hypothetical protein BDR05DRAFT_954938 [Suillus weaverae]|nr:hypothetical protein BDR05DRAFT_954938 [Suillus weaverae]